jgi:hypothetical protein
MKKALLCLIFLGLAAGSARADLMFSFSSADQIGHAGNVLVFSGTISYSDPLSGYTAENTPTVYLNSDDVNLSRIGLDNLTSFNLSDYFLVNVPVSLGFGQSTDVIALFSYALNNPFVDGPGVYTGTYMIYGGIDDNAQEMLLNNANFTITVPGVTVPEICAAILLIFMVTALLCVFRFTRFRSLGKP